MSSGQFSPEPVDERDIPGEMLSLPALEVSQGEGRVLYSFAVDGKKLVLLGGGPYALPSRCVGKKRNQGDRDVLRGRGDVGNSFCTGRAKPE